MKFLFQTTELTHQYCQEIVECLQSYCGKSEEEAIRLVNMFWSDSGAFQDDDLRLHEYPYYWAMGIAHHTILGDNYPDWCRDPALWPPPNEYLMNFSSGIEN